MEHSPFNKQPSISHSSTHLTARQPSDRQPLVGAVYIRVSTNGQMELSPDSQLREICSYAADQNMTLPEAFIFMEKEGHSGKRAENRPEFQRMIATAKLRPRPFDVILVWKFSRFARNQDESAFYKGMLRKKLGIDVISVSEPVCGGMYGRLIEMIIEWQDEFYSFNLSTEVKRGMAEHARQGGYQAPVPFGYDHNGAGSVPTPNPKEADTVRLIFSRFTESGCSPAEIAAMLNENGCVTKRGNPFDRRAILYILRNPFYTGKIRWNPDGRRVGPTAAEPASIILSEGRHRAIISENQFQKANARLCTATQGAANCADRLGPSNPLDGAACMDHCSRPAGTLRSQPEKSPRHLLSGILKCPVCGAALSYSSSQSPSFQCWRYGRGLHKGSASISERRAMAALLASLEELEHTAGDASQLWVPRKNPAELRAKELLKLNKSLAEKEKRILSAYENGVDSLDEYKEKKERIEVERRMLSKESRDQPAALPAVTGLSQLICSPQVKDQVKNQALRLILTSICYHRDEDRFHFYYLV